MDFLSDLLFDGRRLHILTIFDHLARRCPAIEFRTGYRGVDVVETLERVA